MKIITEGQTGYGILIENDAGLINPYLHRNQDILKEGKNNENFLNNPVLYCVLQRYDVPNMNKRIYPKDILVSAVEEYKKTYISLEFENLKVVASMGEVDHDNETSVALKNTGLVITDLFWEGNALMGEVKLIISRGFKESGIVSAPGDQIANLILNDVLVGISSRSIGSVKKGDNDYNIVQEDLKIICWDAVSVPSTPLAYLYTDKKEASKKVSYTPPKPVEQNGNVLYDKKKNSKLDKIADLFNR